MTRRWAGYLVLTVLFAAACAGLGLWQVSRRNDAVTEINRVAANYDSPPVPVATALKTLASFDESEKWRPVTMTGTYLVDEALLVRNRPLNGPGFEQLVPLQLKDGSVFIVDRGWLPTGQRQDSPDHVPAPPSGTVTVVARLKASEPTVGNRSAPAGQIATIHLPDIASRLGLPTYTGAYGLLDSETPPPAEERPIGVTKPAPDEGPHLSYAFQWFVFGLLGFFGLAYIIRNEYRLANSDDPAEQERAAQRAAKRAQRRPTDAEIEDQILDRTS